MNVASSLGQVSAGRADIPQPADGRRRRSRRLEANVGSVFRKRKSPLHKIVCSGGSAGKSPGKPAVPGPSRGPPAFIATPSTPCPRNRQPGRAHPDGRERPVSWLPNHGGGTVRATAANGVADQLQKVSRELDLLPESMIKYLVPMSGTYTCRPIASSPSAVHRDLLLSLALQLRLPTVSPFRYFTSNGGLASYGPVADDGYERAATYVDRVLKGERPANLPVQAPTKYELVINLRTVKAIDLALPQTPRRIADIAQAGVHSLVRARGIAGGSVAAGDAVIVNPSASHRRRSGRAKSALRREGRVEV
jgi:hypothetical protein